MSGQFDRTFPVCVTLVGKRTGCVDRGLDRIPKPRGVGRDCPDSQDGTQFADLGAERSSRTHAVEERLAGSTVSVGLGPDQRSCLRIGENSPEPWTNVDVQGDFRRSVEGRHGAGWLV